MNDNPIIISKKNSEGININIPDLILRNDLEKDILIIEAKKDLNLKRGLEEIKLFDILEEEYVNKYYPNYNVYRYIVTYGGNVSEIVNEKVLLHLNSDGTFYINNNAPEWFNNIFI
ncbi:MAG: hypothetical protein LUH05_05415 [Candidatus Gastranaerophilales bacterium]|nr:hypothetical protein [Candidatus Gastranaerophilales bacterium]